MNSVLAPCRRPLHTVRKHDRRSARQARACAGSPDAAADALCWPGASGAGCSPTVAVVGAGAVGSTIAYALLMRGIASHVAIYDVNAKKVEAEVADLSHGLVFTPCGEAVSGGDSPEVCRGADVVVVTAGARQRPGQSRMALADSSVALVQELMPRLVEVAPDAVYVMVTNPVDVVTHAALRASGLPRARVFGSGTVLDSARLRHALAQRVGVAELSVHANIVGEHGDTEFALWSSATVGGVPLLQWHDANGGLGAAEREEIMRDVVSAAYRVIEGKGATNYAIGLATARIVGSVLRNEHRVLPVSTLVEDYHGISNVCLSVPTIVGRAGAGARLLVPMTDNERGQLHASATSIQETARRCGVL